MEIFVNKIKNTVFFFQVLNEYIELLWNKIRIKTNHVFNQYS